MVMLYVWLNFEGIIHFELVPNVKTYIPNNSKVKYTALVNQRRVLLQQDNTQAHTSRLTKNKIQEIQGIEMIDHQRIPQTFPFRLPSF